MKQLQYQIRTRGYDVIPRLLDKPAVERLKRCLTTAIEAYRPRAGSERSELDRYNIHDLLTRDDAFIQLLDDERLDAALAPLIGDYWILYAFTASSLPPNGSNYARRVHVDSPRRLDGYVFNVGVMWALDDFTLDNGAPEFLPGSHHSDEMPDEDQFAAGRAQVTCKAGDLVVFNARVFHRAGINRTQEWRHALTMNACRSYMKQRIDWPRFLPASAHEHLSPRARRILGYDTRVPSNLDELFLPEADRLYKPNQG